MNIRDSKFFSTEDTVEKILTADWVANNNIKDIPSDKVTTYRQINRIKNLNSSSQGTYNTIQVISIDDPNEYSFDKGVFKVINSFMKDTRNTKYIRILGFLRLYAIGFFEEWVQYLEKADDLVESGPNVDPKTAHNIYDDILEDIDNRNRLIEKALLEIIKPYPELESKRLRILRISTTHQIEYFMNSIDKLIKDPDDKRTIVNKVGKLRNDFVVDKESNIIKEFIKRHPNYVTWEQYSHKASDFKDYLFKLLPSSTVIAINKNVYGACELNLS